MANLNKDQYIGPNKEQNQSGSPYLGSCINQVWWVSQQPPKCSFGLSLEKWVTP